VTFADVAGIDEAKDELEEIIQFLKDPKRFTRLGGRIPKGVLLVGPPGTGKTLLARAIAGEAGVPFFSISGSDFVEMFVGVGASRVRDLFVQGKKHAPCIIFIDEIDAVGRHRGAGLGGGHDEREQTLNQLLVEMDGFEANEGVILVAATNRPDVLDPALLRPGRFDRRVVVPRPDVKGREGILRVHTRRVPLGDDVDVIKLARATSGFAGADLENLVNEAALLAARRSKEKVEMHDFELAKDKVLMGTERRSMVMSADERRKVAYHESGHALVAALQSGADPLHKVTIIPRGMALGLTQQLPLDDRYTESRQYLMTMLAVFFGGRVAEQIVFNEMWTGAGNDIERATELARKMVCEWGMSEELGPMTFGKHEEQVFLGRDLGHTKDYSEHTAVEIDREVRRLLNNAYETAKRLLTENITLLHALAERLIEKEVVDGAEVAEMVKAYREGRPLTPLAAPAGNPPAGGPAPREKQPRAGEEEGAVPVILPPKPSLA
jgi:cell division protease FtsH